MQKDQSYKILALFVFAFVGVCIITITKYVGSNKAQEAAITDALEKIDNPEEKTDQQKTEESELPLISVSGARKKIYTLFVDIRSRDLFAENHIRKSVHIENFKQEDFPQIKTIILVPENDERGEDEQKLLSLVNSMPEKYETLVLSGGFKAWQKAGIPTIKKADIGNPIDLNKIKLVEPRDLDAKKDSLEILIIDTRSSAAFARNHIPGAINIPFGRIEQAQRKIPLGKDVYVYGNDDLESFSSGVLLYDLNYTNTYTISGGFKAWQEFGYPTEQN